VLHRCSHPISTLCTTYYSNPYVLWISWLVPWSWSVGLIFLSSLVLSSWETEQFSPKFPTSCSGSFLGFFLQVFQNRFKISQWRSQDRSRCIVITMSEFYHLLPTLRLICGVSWVWWVWHTLVAFVAESKSGSQKVGTWSNPDLMEWRMSRGEGENGLTLGNFWVFYREDNPYSWQCRSLRWSIYWSRPFLDG
jgi:hypothetical protein